MAVHAESPNDIMIVVNKKVPVDTLTIKELKNFFLKKQFFWSRAGSDVRPINAKAGSDLRRLFLRRTFDWTETEEVEYWRTSKIQHGISKPVESSHTLKAVFSVEGSISYVFRSDYHKDVCKVVLILPNEIALVE
jgi:ABC-type phosphate transport system substrate-binding protein